MFLRAGGFHVEYFLGAPQLRIRAHAAFDCISFPPPTKEHRQLRKLTLPDDLMWVLLAHLYLSCRTLNSVRDTPAEITEPSVTLIASLDVSILCREGQI
jgi:hypothetical protein